MRPAPLVLLCLIALAVVAPGSARAATLSIENGISDNYKASYNADPTAPESRTWLSMDRIHAAGTTWRPAIPAAISFTAPLALTGADGRSASLSLRIVRGRLATTTLRFDPDGRWGPLVTIADRSTLAASPPRLGLILAADATTLATGVVDYRPASFAGPGSAIEQGGPGGRWFVGSQGLRTDWEARGATGVIVASDARPPTITRIQLPLRTTRRVVPLRVHASSPTGIAITHVRVRIDGGRYGRWVRVAARYSVRLPAGRATRLVRIQARDALGSVSIPASRRVTCRC